MPLYRFGLRQQDVTDEIQWHQHDVAAIKAAAIATAELHRNCSHEGPEWLVLMFRVEAEVSRHRSEN